MSTSDMKSRAATTIKAAGITDERGVAVQEGFASAAATNFDDTIGDVIPGASLLVAGASRIVLVTDLHVYLFKGRRFDRPGIRLGSYGIGPGAMSYDGKKVTFPDGQVVYLTKFQAKVLSDAAGVDVYSGGAEEVLLRAGISGERAVTVQTGSTPKAPKTTVGARIFEVTIGGGDLDFREESEGRIILVTDRQVHVFAGSHFSQLGAPLASYEVGPGVLSRDNETVTFPNGEVVKFAAVSDARRVTDAAGGELR